MNKLIIIGLGPGSEDHLTKSVLDILKNHTEIYLRTEKHPVLSYLLKTGVIFKSFDYAYEELESFDMVYDHIVEALIQKASEADIVYAVPGHPMVAENTVHKLLKACRDAGIETIVHPAMSFIDVLLSVVGADPIDGFKLLDALQMEEQKPDTKVANIITQVYDPFMAAEVKLHLMEYYDDEELIYVIRAAGVPELERVEKIPLYQLDRLDWIDYLTSIYIPKAVSPEKKYYNMNNLIDIMERLRNKDGCPWDIKQTHESLKSYLIEESYEVLDAIDLQDDDLLVEELGDLLLQVVFHSQIAKERQVFSIEDVIHGIADKLVFRHPHVFTENKANNCEEALESWEGQKREEKQIASITESMELIPKDLPALMKAYKIQKKAATVGFDWDRVEDVLNKVHEELQELQEAIREGNEKEIHSEAGDVVFSVVNLLRFYDVDPEEALRGTCQKFLDRFRYIEETAKTSGKELKDMNLDEMDILWEQAKKTMLNSKNIKK